MLNDTIAKTKTTVSVANEPPSALVSILSDLKWPLLILILALVFYKTISTWFSKLTKAKVLGNEFESGPAPQQLTVQQLQTHVIKKQTLAEKAIGIYKPETVDSFKNLVIEQSEIGALNDDSEKLELLIKYTTLVVLNRTFDTIYADIFGSQILLLQYLNSLVGVGDTRDNLKVYYDQAVARYPTSFDNYTYDQYFQFLINQKLIVPNNNKYVITIGGIDFLKYLVETNKNLNKNY